MHKTVNVQITKHFGTFRVIIVVEKQCVKYYSCMSVVLVFPHAKRLCHIILLFVACLAPLYISTLSHKGTIFGKKLLDIKCVFRVSLQLLSEPFLIRRRIQRDTT
jgi:hypothetical protein